MIASLIVHVAIVLVIADGDVRRAVGQPAVTTTAAPSSSNEVAYLVPTPPPQRLEKLLFGDARGTEDSISGRAGVRPMISREGGQTQAFLSRDPVGPGEIVNEPAMSVLPTRAAAMSPAITAPPSPPAPRMPFGFADREGWSVPQVTRPAANVPPPTPAAGEEAPGTAVSAAPAADPALMSDSESDPFTKRSGPVVEFRDGRVVARFGRKVKTVRPHLSLASRLDLMGMQFPRLIVRVSIHIDGSVRRVDIVKSSGSSSADQEVKVALYRWWFEPMRENVVEFPIAWR